MISHRGSHSGSSDFRSTAHSLTHSHARSHTPWREYQYPGDIIRVAVVLPTTTAAASAVLLLLFLLLVVLVLVVVSWMCRPQRIAITWSSPWCNNPRWNLVVIDQPHHRIDQPRNCNNNQSRHRRNNKCPFRTGFPRRRCPSHPDRKRSHRVGAAVHNTTNGILVIITILIISKVTATTTRGWGLNLA